MYVTAWHRLGETFVLLDFLKIDTLFQILNSKLQRGEHRSLAPLVNQFNHCFNQDDLQNGNLSKRPNKLTVSPILVSTDL